MNTADNRQRVLALPLRDIKRSLHLHPDREISACKSKSQACRLALIHAGMSQDDVADRLPISKGHMSHLLSGRKRWTDDMQFRFEQICGSLAPSQWDAARRGLSLYADPVEVRKAQLLDELHRLERAA